MKLNLINRVTVKCGDEIRKTHNAMNDVFSMIGACAYGDYLAVGGGAGGDDGKTVTPIVTLKTSVGDKNLATDRGYLFVRYEAVATDSDISAGTSISEIGLCATAGGTLADYASFDPVVKKSGENLYFSVEVRLNYTAGGSTVFCGGNNQFAASLLGLRKLSTVFHVAGGSNFHPNVPFARSGSNVSYRTAVTPTITTDSITFDGIINAGVYEALVLMDGIPVLRDYHGTETSNNVTRTVGAAHCCDIIGMYEWVGSVTSGGSPVSGYEVRPYCEKMTGDGVNILPYRIAKNAYFLGEPSGSYFAVVSDHEIVVYVVRDTVSTLYYKIPRGGGDPCLCTDGSIFTAEGNSVVRFSPTDGAVTKTEYVRGAAVKNVHAVLGEGTLVAFAEGGDYVCVKIDGNGVTELKRISSVPSDFYAWRLNNRFLGYICKSSGVALCYGANGDYAAATTVLTSLLADKYEILKIGDEWLWVHDTSVSQKYAVCPFCDVLHSTLNADEIAFSNAYTVRSENGAVFRVTTYYNTRGIEKTMQFAGTVPQPTSVVQVGSYILFTDGSGEVWYRFMSRRGYRLYFPYLNKSTSVTIQTAMLKNPNVSGSGTRICFTIRRNV